MADDSTTRCLLFEGFERRPVVDERDPSRITRGLRELLRQRVYGQDVGP